MNPSKLDYWIDQNITHRWHAWLCKRNYHRIVWESSEGYEHCQCGEAIKDDEEGLAKRLTEIKVREF